MKVLHVSRLYIVCVEHLNSDEDLTALTFSCHNTHIGEKANKQAKFRRHAHVLVFIQPVICTFCLPCHHHTFALLQAAKTAAQSKDPYLLHKYEEEKRRVDTLRFLLTKYTAKVKYA